MNGKWDWIAAGVLVTLCVVEIALWYAPVQRTIFSTALPYLGLALAAIVRAQVVFRWVDQHGRKGGMGRLGQMIAEQFDRPYLSALQYIGHPPVLMIVLASIGLAVMVTPLASVLVPLTLTPLFLTVFAYNRFVAHN